MIPLRIEIKLLNVYGEVTTGDEQDLCGKNYTTALMEYLKEDLNR